MGSHDHHDDDGNLKVECEVCGRWFHQLSSHLARRHELTVEAYRAKYPGAQTMSLWASKNLGQAVSEGKTGKPVSRAPTAPTSTPEPECKPHTPPAEKPKGAPLEVLPIGVARLAVLDPAAMDAEDCALIPQHDEHYYLDNRLLEDVALAIETDVNLLLCGPNGSGKSTIIRELCAILNRPCKRIPLNTETRAADFIGGKTVVIDPDTRKNKVVWVDGVLTRAARKGWVVILDELDLCPPGILARLQEVLEIGHPLTLPENDGEIVLPHPNFRICATANTVGRGDTSGLFPTRKVLDEATLDRFGMVREVSYLSEANEIKVIVDKCKIKEPTARLMVNTATKVRDGLNRDACRCSFSTRRLLTWGCLIARLGDVKRAAEITVLQRLVREDREFVKGVIDRIFPR